MQPLALCASDRACQPFAVIYFAGIPAETKLGNVAMQMLAADVVECVVDATLEQRERGFDGVATNPAGSRALACTMIGHADCHADIGVFASGGNFNRAII